MRQENEKLKSAQANEQEIFEMTAEETLCVAGGPEVENDPRS